MVSKVYCIFDLHCIYYNIQVVIVIPCVYNVLAPSCTQLTELTLNLLGRQIGGGFPHMQPSQDMRARMLTALVLHVVTAVMGKQRDPLLKPFVTILTSPATMVVSYAKLLYLVKI